jgi:hypothetical protein
LQCRVDARFADALSQNKELCLLELKRSDRLVAPMRDDLNPLPARLRKSPTQIVKRRVRVIVRIIPKKEDRNT